MDIFYPVKIFADWLTYRAFSLSVDSRIAAAVDFFVYDTIKIFILLAVIIFVISVIRSFLPPAKIKQILSHRNKYIGNLLAALFGIITPFCTCSAIPLFLGFNEAGIPLGVTFSFLVSSPMINEVALVMLLGMFGLKIALIYALSGLVIATLSGIIIGELKLERLIEQKITQPGADSFIAGVKLSWKERLVLARGHVVFIIKSVWPYILAGIGVGAWMHGYVPQDFLVRYAGGDKWYAVLLATLIGIPLYSNAAGIIPLVSVLSEKGVSIGATLSFMMAVTGLSLPEFMILKKVMKLKLLAIFIAIVGAGIVFTGYLFNFILR